MISLLISHVSREILHCWLIPVKNGVDIRLVTQISSPALNINQVGHHINKAEQLNMVYVQNTPGPEKFSVLCM